MFSSSQNIDFPFLFAETLEAFLFSFLFLSILFSLSLFFNAPSLCGLEDLDDKRGEKHSPFFLDEIDGMAKP
jgi:hypothetical protein